MGKALDLSGQRFGRLVAKRPTEERRGGKVVWECECDCGNLTKTISVSLRYGVTRSCGCLKREASKVNVKKADNLIHGHSIRGKWSRVYVTWAAMIQRCENPKNKAYKDYGGRGIKVCNRWLKFDGFLEDMGERPRTTSIERKDNDGNYEPGNCRWASAIEQGRNRRHVRLNPLKVQVIKKLLKESKLMLTEIAEIFDVTRWAIYSIKTGKTWSNITYEPG